MQYLITIFCLVLPASVSTTQKHINMIEDIALPHLNKQPELFDVTTFEQCRRAPKGQYIINTDRFYERQNDQSFGYTERRFDHGSYFSTLKQYFHNSMVWKKGIYFSKSPIGTWYEFNEQGELTAEVDADEGYTFSWRDMLKYCAAHEIVLTKGYVRGGYQTKLYKVTEEGRKAWEITYQSDHDKITHVILDAETGEEIRRETMKYINN